MLEVLYLAVQHLINHALGGATGQVLNLDYVLGVRRLLLEPLHDGQAMLSSQG